MEVLVTFSTSPHCNTVNFTMVLRNTHTLKLSFVIINFLEAYACLAQLNKYLSMWKALVSNLSILITPYWFHLMFSLYF